MKQIMSGPVAINNVCFMQLILYNADNCNRCDYQAALGCLNSEKPAYFHDLLLFSDSLIICTRILQLSNNAHNSSATSKFFSEESLKTSVLFLQSCHVEFSRNLNHV